MKIRIPRPDSAAGALVYATAGAAFASMGELAIRHLHIVITWR